MGSKEVGAGYILSSGMGAVSIPDDKKNICIITMVATIMILRYFFCCLVQWALRNECNSSKLTGVFWIILKLGYRWLHMFTLFHTNDYSSRYYNNLEKEILCWLAVQSQEIEFSKSPFRI